MRGCTSSSPRKRYHPSTLRLPLATRPNMVLACVWQVLRLAEDALPPERGGSLLPPDEAVQVAARQP